jgi:hypothetical protein
VAQSFKLKGRDCDELTTCALAVRDWQFIMTEFDVAHLHSCHESLFSD